MSKMAAMWKALAKDQKEDLWIIRAMLRRKARESEELHRQNDALRAEIENLKGGKQG